MSSLIRRMGKRIAKKVMSKEELKAHKESKRQSFRMHDDGSYDVLHYTKGWRHVSAKRIAAQFKMAQILGRS
jgi:hypothetical protein